MSKNKSESESKGWIDLKYIVPLELKGAKLPLYKVKILELKGAKLPLYKVAV